MNNNEQQKTEGNKNNGVHWLLWWIIDDEEIKQQLDQYDKLKITQSARGWSFLLLLLSGIITTLFIIFGNFENSAFLDVFIFLILGFFIYRGHKWAMVCAMLLWTFEKIFMLYDRYRIASSNGTSTPNIIVSLIWWSTYMHIFYLAFKTERLRIKKVKQDKQEKEYAWICDFCDKKFDSEKEVAEHEKICQLKNKEDNTIFCIKCGTKNKTTSNFCIKCGNKIIH